MTVHLHSGEYFVVKPGTLISVRHETLAFVAVQYQAPDGSNIYDFPTDRDGVQIIPIRGIKEIRP